MDNNAGILYHTWGAMIERASRDSRIVPGEVLGAGTVTGGSIGEVIRNGFPARISNQATSWRSRSKGQACCVKLSRRK